MPGDVQAGDGRLLNDTLTAVSGVRVGHWTDGSARTGCTVVLLPSGGAVTSALALGTGPGTRELALLEPEKSVERVHAVVLSGGSAYGLATASGVMRWLEARGEGFDTPFGKVPIVPAAVLFDLGVGRPDVRPGEAEGWQAAEAAHDGRVQEGAIGAGAGATVDSIRGADGTLPSGLGSVAFGVGGVTIAALAISNAGGAIVDPADGRAVAGRPMSPEEAFSLFAGRSGGRNTTLVAVVTDAELDKAGCRALATAAHIGIARVTRPSHTAFDGDTCFVSATGTAGPAPVAALGVAVQEAVAAAILRGVRAVRNG